MRALTLMLAVLTLGCADTSDTPTSTPYVFVLPEGFPEPPVPADNPMTVEKVTLGRRLFYDKRLSGNGTQSCGSCHDQKKGFADGLDVSKGSTGDFTPRNSLGLANVAYNTTLTWANPTLTTLEAQFKVPMFGENPVELGITGHEALVLGRLEADPDYPSLFAAAFPEDPDPIGFDNTIAAISAFVRTLISGDSRYDRYAYGLDSTALTASEKRGLSLFFGEKAECYHCHGGFNLSNATTQAGLSMTEAAFFNNGLYNIDGKGAFPAPNVGLWTFTGKATDMGRFRTPSLRNIALTGPYMHDGSITTLEAVVRHYEAGGRNITEGQYVGDGRANPFKDPLLTGFQLTDQERADLVAFLNTLTDETFVSNPAFSDPFQ
jgi:cytochrome c peroxidase